MKPTEVADLIAGRSTIHDFEPDRIPPRDTILESIRLATRAPNHYLSEPWRFYLLGEQSKTAIVNLNAELVTAKKGAEAGEAKRQRWGQIPGWMVVTCAKSRVDLRQREDYAACCCAIQNLSLYLWSEGVGVKWTTGLVTRKSAFYDALWIDPEVEELVGLLWYGYPLKVPETRRKPIEQVILDLP